MNRALVAGAALLVGMAIAAPLGWSADDPAGQGEPEARGGAGMEEMMRGMHGMGGMHGMMGMRDHDGAEHPGGMRGMMMHRMMQRDPRQRCEERLARRAGMIAYTVAKLNLTAEQKPLLDKLQGPLQAAADRERQLCAAMKPAGERGQETILDRVNRREQLLSVRLQGLHEVRPALEQLYQSLTADQKTIIDHPFQR